MNLEHYPWTDRWLTGPEYKKMIVNHEAYSQAFGLDIVDSHPAAIYSNPGHGVIYFLRAQTLKDLGFPRVKGLRKSFKWKKMNFLTPLPKQGPQVHYLVATGRLANICYRMHVVACTPDLPLLCHTVLPVDSTPKIAEGHSQGTQVVKQIRTERWVESPMKRSKKMHPVDRIALRYWLAPFQKGEENSVGDNGEGVQS